MRFGVYWGDPLAAERALGERLAELGGPERVVRFGDEVELGELLAELATPGLFGGERAIVVRRADPLARVEALAEALRGGPPPGTAVFFLGEDLRGPLARAAQEAKGFPSPSGRELRRLAAELLSAAGLPPDQGLVELLCEACRGDTLRLAQEVEKLALWGERLPDRESLPKLVFFAEPTPYAFLDAIGERRIPQALAELKRLLSSGWDPFRLFFMLISHLRALLAARAAWEDGRTPPGPEWLARRRLSQARRFSQQELIELLERLQELDLGIKTGALTPAGALWTFTLALAP